ncbi:MAG: hypothetical protein QNK03_17130 [Myxococcota bacterium]|nr:hypothetical protein [Myxococcota bacterium]
MATTARRRRSRPDLVRVLGIGLVGVAGVLGLVLLASALGWSPLGGANEPAPPRGAQPGMVAVPTAAIAIPAYAEIRLEHLIDPRTRAPSLVYLPEASILHSTVIDARELIGRVLARPKPAGRVFADIDFLPKGTRPGIVAGIPPGKRAMRVDASQVSGLVGLGQGDRFDLLATRAVKANTGTAAPATTSETIVAGGSVVTPLERRQVAAGTSGARIVEEVVIAIDPTEAPALSEALTAKARIDCVPHSGLPDAGLHDSGEAARRSTSGRGTAVIETISGSRRENVAVPRS